MTIPTKTFEVGDRVRWTSQAGGNTKSKEGVIVQALEQNESVRDDVLKMGTMQFDQRVSGRKQRSYIVLVSNGSTRMKGLYWPLVSGLELVARDHAGSEQVQFAPETSSPQGV